MFLWKDRIKQDGVGFENGYEKITYLHDSVLQKVSVPDENHEMSLLSYLFGIRTGSGGKIRRF